MSLWECTVDRPVSGVTIFAKDPVARRLNTMFRRRGVKNIGPGRKSEPPENELVHFLKKNENQNSYAIRWLPGQKSRGSKEARLRYKPGQTERYWLIEVELLTGRHHQIRCQLSAIGCPIRDLKYGARCSNLTAESRCIQDAYPDSSCNQRASYSRSTWIDHRY